MIENTSESLKDPDNALLFLAASMGPGGSDQAIAEQERAGQAQLLNSVELPTDMQGGSRADYEAAGFRFEEPTPGDPLFMKAALPNGWKRESSDHAMWSYIIDEKGRRRVAVFYKAAFYDRRAHMTLKSVFSYLYDCAHNNKPVVTDDTWANPEAIVQAATSLAKQAQADLESWTERGNAKYVAEYTAQRDVYAALAAKYEAVGEA